LNTVCRNARSTVVAVGDGDGAGRVAVGTRGSERRPSTEIVACVDGVDDDVAVEAEVELELEVDVPDDPHPTARSALTSSTAASVEARPHGRGDGTESFTLAWTHAGTEKITGSLRCTTIRLRTYRTPVCAASRACFQPRRAH
jgi:hypothetical protein